MKPAGRFECCSCGDEVAEGLVRIADGTLLPETAKCRDCINEVIEDGDGRAALAEPREGPTCDEFVAAMDPALAAWLDSQPPDLWASRDMKMAASYGELLGLYELARLSDQSGNILNAFETYLANRTTLRRHSDSLDFVRSLTRHMSAPKGTDDLGGNR